MTAEGCLVMKNLPKLLKYMRNFGHYTQLDMAGELGISRSYISEIEKGLKVPSMEVLMKYAAFYEVPLSSLLLFAENLDNKKDFKSRVKKILTVRAMQWLKWICEDKRL